MYDIFSFLFFEDMPEKMPDDALEARQETYGEFPSEYGSDYLEKGFAQDRMRIHDIHADFENKRIEGQLDLSESHVNQYADIAQNAFHLSSITAYRFVSQLIVFYICRDLGFEKNELGEIYQVRHEISNSQKIENRENIKVDIRFTRYDKDEKEGKLKAVAEFNIQDSFTGKFVLVAPLPKKAI